MSEQSIPQRIRDVVLASKQANHAPLRDPENHEFFAINPEGLTRVQVGYLLEYVGLKPWSFVVKLDDALYQVDLDEMTISHVQYSELPSYLRNKEDAELFVHSLYKSFQAGEKSGRNQMRQQWNDLMRTEY